MRTKLLIVAALLLALAAGLLWRHVPWREPTPPVVGLISLSAVDERTQAGFFDRMKELGYREGRDIVYRVSPPALSIERLDGLVQEHLDADVDLLFVSSTPATLAVQRATAERPIPVVFAPVNDPLGTGIVADLGEPGGNITGIRLPRGDNLRLEWMLDLGPTIRHIYFPYNPQDKSSLETLKQVREGAKKLGAELLLAPVRNLAEIDAAAAAIPREADAVFLPRDSSVESRIDRFVTASLAAKVPLCAPSLLQVEAGALLSYGFNHFQIGRQAARLVHQILRDVDPAILPVETAESYLAVNLKSAEAIGLELPEHLLRQAATVIR